MKLLRTLLLAGATALALSACLPPPHHDGPGRHGDHGDRGDHGDHHDGGDHHDDDGRDHH